VYVYVVKMNNKSKK